MCSIENIEYNEDVTQWWSVDDDGQLLELMGSTGGDFKYYECKSCGNTFGDGTYDPDPAWKEVLQHLKENADE